MTILHEIPRIDSLQAVNQWLRRECREKDERIARLEALVDGLANRLANAAEVLAVRAERKERRNV